MPQDLHAHAEVAVITEGPQFSTRAESHIYRSLQTNPPISCIGMTSMPESKLFREAEIAYALVCMATDYDSWHETLEGVSVEMVMGHMKANSANAKAAIVEILKELDTDAGADLVNADRLQWASRGGVMGLGTARSEAVDKLRWLFGDKWIQGSG